jgi:hypothetical protein
MFIVIHISHEVPSILAASIDGDDGLPTAFATDGETDEPSRSPPTTIMEQTPLGEVSPSISVAFSSCPL